MLESQAAIDRLGEQAKSIPGWNGVGTDTTAMEQTTAAAAKLRLLVARAADSPAQTGALRSALQSLLNERREELTAGSPLHQAVFEYSRTYRLFSAALAEFDRLAESPQSGSSPNLLETAERHTALLIGNISGLNRWTAWLRVRKEALSLGLEPLIDALEQGAISPADTLSAFESAYARWWVEQALDDASVLRTSTWQSTRIAWLGFVSWMTSSPALLSATFEPSCAESFPRKLIPSCRPASQPCTISSSSQNATSLCGSLSLKWDRLLPR